MLLKKHSFWATRTRSSLLLLIGLLFFFSTAQRGCRPEAIELEGKGVTVSVKFPEESRKPLEASLKEVKETYGKLLTFCKQQDLESDDCVQLEAWWASFVESVAGELLGKASAPKELTVEQDAVPRILIGRNVYILRVYDLITSAIKSDNKDILQFSGKFAQEHRVGHFVYGTYSESAGVVKPRQLVFEELGQPQVLVVEADAIFSIGDRQVNFLEFVTTAQTAFLKGKKDRKAGTYTLGGSGIVSGTILANGTNTEGS